MSEQKAYLIINGVINKANPAEAKAYIGNMKPVFAENNGVPIGRYMTLEQIGGEQGPEVVAIVEFPSVAAIKGMTKSKSFQALAESRAKAFTKLDIMISGAM